MELAMPDLNEINYIVRSAQSVILLRVWTATHTKTAKHIIFNISLVCHRHYNLPRYENVSTICKVNTSHIFYL